MSFLRRRRPSGQSTHTLIGGLAALYEAPEWALFTEVRSSTGPHDVLRIADAFAVHTLDRPWRMHGFEMKRSRKDWQRELSDPAKSAPLRLFCSSWWLVVPCPWKHVVLSLRELPALWGLIEVGTGAPSIVHHAPERPAEEPTIDFLQALLRSAARPASDRDVKPGNAPDVEITHPGLSRARVGLACGHSAPRPLSKVPPRTAPCWSCAEGEPTDRELLEAAIDDASEDELRALAARIEARLPRAA
jgi:hypothetical protein